MLRQRLRIHLIGIGGSGMSPIAKLLLDLGHEVSGSDIKTSTITEKLSSLGATVSIGHRPENIDGKELVVFSSAIKDDNRELSAARERGIPAIHRARMLAQLMEGKRAIAVTGTHGKTTTTSLIASILSRAGFSPTVAIGAELDGIGGSAILGKGPYFVAEADESDGSFIELSPMYSVLTNIEEEHLDFYQGMDEILDAYRNFAGRMSEDGVLIGCGDDKYVREIIASCGRRSISYGLTPLTDIYAKDIALKHFGSQFDCWYKGKFLGRITLGIPERHNILNSLAAVGIAMELKIDFEPLKEALANYRGAARRFEIKLNTNELVVIDDYAHHQTEVKATLSSCMNQKRRVVCVFQPHRYSRTKHLGERLGRVLASADKIILTDIYSANESPIEGVSTRGIYDAVKREGHANVELVRTKEDALERTLKTLRPQDLVVCLGAGDIGWVADQLAERFKKL